MCACEWVFEGRGIWRYVVGQWSVRKLLQIAHEPRELIVINWRDEVWFEDWGWRSQRLIVVNLDRWWLSWTIAIVFVELPSINVSFLKPKV